MRREEDGLRTVWRLTIRLTGVMPVVWRTILVQPETKLATLHRYLQAAMGWYGQHLFSFSIGGRAYEIPDREWPTDRKIYDARRYTLARLFPTIPTRFGYLYDFGDQWEHIVEIETAEGAEARKQYPVCVAGAESCPPEDCGGPEGYRDFIAALRDPRHPDHAEVRAWAADRDPADFHPPIATRAMRRVQRRLS
jgi:hypothetical protein